MVWQRMGLLDDAIREHLELKRLRGADPGMVSREEHEVFGTAQGHESGPDDGRASPEQSPIDEGSPHAQSEPAEPGGFSNVGQETAEIDMRAVLEDEQAPDSGSTGPVAAAPVAARPRSEGRSGERQDGDSLEWEMPGGEAAAEGTHGSGMDAGEAQDEPVEDVLEETPDFLRDTPEQERLWFEQRPPRDFDFDK
jgi:hypothetical protein